MNVYTAFSNIHDDTLNLKNINKLWSKSKTPSEFISGVYTTTIYSHSYKMTVALSKYILKHHWVNQEQTKLNDIQDHIKADLKVFSFDDLEAYINDLKDILSDSKWTKKDGSELTETDMYKLSFMLQKPFKKQLSDDWSIVDTHLLPQLKGFLRTEQAYNKPNDDEKLPLGAKWFRTHHIARAIANVMMAEQVLHLVSRNIILYEDISNPPHFSYHIATYFILISYLKYAVKNAEQKTSIQSISAWYSTHMVHTL